MHVNHYPTRFLMCEPVFFGVEYEINTWMQGNIGCVNPANAMKQWEALYQLLAARATVVCMPPVAGLPDLTFTANAGLIYQQQFFAARFHHPQRQAEEHHVMNWFREQGYTVHHTQAITFEGEGDALFQREAARLWLGYGMRSSNEAVTLFATLPDITCVPLRLVDPRFYHLDTCLAPLPDGGLLYYPPAFDAPSLAQIHAYVPVEKRIEVSEADALNFACNAIIVAGHFICNQASDALRKQLAQFELAVLTTPLDEFMLAGGAAKCLTLILA